MIGRTDHRAESAADTPASADLIAKSPADRFALLPVKRNALLDEVGAADTSCLYLQLTGRSGRYLSAAH
jgi:hypothetical protein